MLYVMGVTKQYLRFVPGPVFGIVGSTAAKVLFLNNSRYFSNLVAVGACENIIIWNYRTNERHLTLYGANHAVTSLASENQVLAAGYVDGTIRLFDLQSGKCIVTFSGHKSSVSCLTYEVDNMRLASGGKDGQLVLWDVVHEAGMFKLKGHKGPITHCSFLKQRNVLVSSSKDTFIKFWDLDTQHCFETLVGHRAEVWDFVMLNDYRFIAGVNNSALKLWDVHFKDVNADESKAVQEQHNSHTNDLLIEENEEESRRVTYSEAGSLLIQGEKHLSVRIDKTERLLGCHDFSKLLHLFKILTSEEITKKCRKRRRKEKKAGSQTECDEDADNSVTFSDEFQRLKVVTTDGKISSFDIVVNKQIAKIAVLMSNNSIEIFCMNFINNSDPELLHNIKHLGHRTDVRTLAFSSDSLNVLSASGESVKIWNRESQKCVLTVQCDYALACLFCPGNSYCIIGTKSGKFQIFDVCSGVLVENIEAHEGPVWCVCASPDQQGITSGSGDKDIKFWQHELIKDENYSETKKRLTLSLSRTLKMSEEVLCVKYSADQKHLAASLLDCTVKVFFSDSLKFNFSLYGHKLPVLCMDISSDNTLLVTGSADRNVKIWSMEFGSCNKSIFAHDDSIMCLQFLPRTHMFFTGSKDKSVKQWDADNFQKILTLEGHQAEVWALTTSPDGTTVVTSSHDKSLRLWEKTSELLILSEEQEIEREKEIDKSITSAEDPVIVGQENKEVALSSKKTIEAIKSVEQLIEAIDIYSDEVYKLEEYKKECKAMKKALPSPTPHPLLVALASTDPLRFMLKVMQKLKTSELEQTLLHLPFKYVVNFLKILSEILSNKWEVELSVRCILFLLRIHCSQLLSCAEILPVIQILSTKLFSEIASIRDTVGFNIAGLKFLHKQMSESEELSLFFDATEKLNKKRKTKKRQILLTTYN